MTDLSAALERGARVMCPALGGSCFTEIERKTRGPCTVENCHAMNATREMLLAFLRELEPTAGMDRAAELHAEESDVDEREYDRSVFRAMRDALVREVEGE